MLDFYYKYADLFIQDAQFLLSHMYSLSITLQYQLYVIKGDSEKQNSRYKTLNYFFMKRKIYNML